MTYARLSVVLVATLVSACGGSSLSVDEKLTQLNDQGTDIFETFIEDQDPIAASALPAAGSITYTGPIVARGGVGRVADSTFQSRVAFLGEAEVRIAFADGTLDGTVDDFLAVENFLDAGQDDVVLVADGTVDGSLTLTGTQASTPQAQYDIVANGRLDAENGAFLDYQDVGGRARVFGADADALLIGGSANAPFDGEDGTITFGGVAAR